jgi:hypothetical protein
MPLQENRPLREVYVNCQTTSVATTPVVARCVSPVRGRILKIYSVLGGVITAADATVTASIAGTAITGGALTITQSGSAAGDVDSAVPTAANIVNEGDEIRLTPAGATGASIPAFFTILIERF